MDHQYTYVDGKPIDITPSARWQTLELALRFAGPPAPIAETLAVADAIWGWLERQNEPVPGRTITLTQDMIEAGFRHFEYLKTRPNPVSPKQIVEGVFSSMYVAQPGGGCCQH